VIGDSCAEQDSSPDVPRARVLLVGEVLGDLFDGFASAWSADRLAIFANWPGAFVAGPPGVLPGDEPS